MSCTKESLILFRNQLACESCYVLVEQDFVSKISKEILKKFFLLFHPLRLKLEKVFFFYFAIGSSYELHAGQYIETNHFLNFKKEVWCDHLVLSDFNKAILDHRD
jgi:hypothetical protein